jgi:formylmethanofuran dehydrogenase subunit E
MAATFCDLREGKSVRIAALESSKDRAKELYPQIENKNQQQMLAYSEMPEEELFSTQWVRVEIGPQEMPGYKAARVTCDVCGEGINFQREIVREGQTLCKSCAGDRYYEVL